jgi:hypothetical protein
MELLGAQLTLLLVVARGKNRVGDSCKDFSILLTPKKKEANNN